VKVYIKSKIDIVSELESVYIKEVTPWFFIIWDIVDHMR
jgi:hypothetical protein